MFVFTLQIAMETVTMEIPRSLWNTIVLLFSLLFLIKLSKKQYTVVKKKYVTIAWFPL